jgi:hypothetical protein
MRHLFGPDVTLLHPDHTGQAWFLVFEMLLITKAFRPDGILANDALPFGSGSIELSHMS